MCEHCPTLESMPEQEWRREVINAIADSHNMAADEHEKVGTLFTGLIDMAARQGAEILQLQEEICTISGSLATLLIAILEPTTDTTALATVLATLGSARTAMTSGAHAPGTSKEGK